MDSAPTIVIRVSGQWPHIRISAALYSLSWSLKLSLSPKACQVSEPEMTGGIRPFPGAKTLACFRHFL